MARATLTEEIVESVGREIASGHIAEGAPLNTEALMSRFDVSRTAMREAIKVLESMGLIDMKRRTGLRVRPIREWNLLDPRIIRWRLGRPDRTEILRSVTELREAVEPVAARIAAQNAQESLRDQLGREVDAMDKAMRDGNPRDFLDADLRFHDMLLVMSGNELFFSLSRSVRGALEGQTEAGVLPVYDAVHTIDLHRAIAQAIAVADPAAAEAAARDLFTSMRRDIESPHP
jgi:DNA-binding FadR family transcriptional regulator